VIWQAKTTQVNKIFIAYRFILNLFAGQLFYAY